MSEQRWYRVDEQAYATGWNEWLDCPTGTVMRTNLRSFKVLRETPCGVWLSVDDKPKFVNRSWNKRPPDAGKISRPRLSPTISTIAIVAAA